MIVSYNFNIWTNWITYRWQRRLAGMCYFVGENLWTIWHYWFVCFSGSSLSPWDINIFYLNANTDWYVYQFHSHVYMIYILKRNWLDKYVFTCLPRLGKIFERITLQEFLKQSYVNSRIDQLNYYILRWNTHSKII